MKSFSDFPLLSIANDKVKKTLEEKLRITILMECLECVFVLWNPNKYAVACLRENKILIRL